ncbi:MAG: VWA domain-containing protein [Bryobacteraceae bacterium]|nr:VWA domain-containing protein [Bryobacteraceae bacterium]
MKPRALAFAALALIAAASAADNAKPALEVRARGAAPEQRQARLRVDSNLVLIPVSVTDPLFRPLEGLSRGHFEVLEDGVPQEIAQVSLDDSPVSVGLVLDASGSIGKQLDTSRDYVRQFLRFSNDQDEYFLIKFADRPELASRFTTQPDDLLGKLFFAKAEGGTAFLDAVYLAMNQMRTARNGRRVILVISDGADNCSRYSRTEVFQMARESDVQVYTVGVFAHETWGARMLERLAEETGGRYYRVTRRDDLGGIAERIGNEIRREYVIGYHSANRGRDGKYRQVRVKVTPPAGSPKPRVSHRTGYYAPSN